MARESGASDLARSLIDAAAEAIAGSESEAEDGFDATWLSAGRAAVVAVLETLAETARHDEDCGCEVWLPPTLRGLAVAVREGR